MLDLLITILGILLTIFFIVGIHEFGHFIMARWLGVKVLRFSIGFGKALFSWHDQKGTEYVIAPIPLGGYVKMLDETEGKVLEKDLPFAFNRQPLYKKIAIVFAGPLFNLLFALGLYWMILVVGYTTVAPIIGKVTPHSIAATAGLRPKDEILQIDHTPTPSWTAVVMRFLAFLGEERTLMVRTQQGEHRLDLSSWKLDGLRPDPLGSLGIVPYMPDIPPVLGGYLPESPAAHAGLQKKDRIVAIEGQPITHWYEVLDHIQQNPGKTLAFSIERKGKVVSLPVPIGATQGLFFKKSGFLGITPDFVFPKTLLRQVQYPLGPAFIHAFQNTLDFTVLNFVLLGKMIIGKMSLQSLGGPITIFQTAGSALHFGLVSFLNFLAFLSIAIGIINVLPVPGLDGGHLLIYGIECIIRRPLSVRVQTLLYRFGLIILLVIVMKALSNDVLRLYG